MTSHLTDADITEENIVGIPDIEKPEWLAEVVVDMADLSWEVDCLMYVEEIQEHEWFIASFVNKVNLEVQQRQTWMSNALASQMRLEIGKNENYQT